MATNFNLPTANDVFDSFIGPGVGYEDQVGILHSFYLIGGHTEVPTLQDMYEIPIAPNPNSTVYDGFTSNEDGGWSSGRRRIGQTVYVIEEDKTYRLIPKGYWSNDGELGMTEWLALSDADKAILIKPDANVPYATGTPPPMPPPLLYQTGTGVVEDCWVEIVGGGDNIYTSNLADSIAMTEDVGGMPSGTAVSDLTNVKTYDQLFDTILFPTSYPTAGQPSTSLSDNVSNLQTIGATIDMILNTTANLGNISLNGVSQGQYAGNVIAASITGESGPYTLGVGPAGNAIDNQPNNNFVVQIGSNSWTLTTTFDDGPMPLDSTGADYPSLQYSSGTKTNSTSFEGVYPIKLGTSVSNNDFENRGLESHANGNNIECSQAYDEDGVTSHRIAISDAMIAGRNVMIEQWSTVSNSYGAVTMANEYVITQTQFTIEGNPVNYTLFTKSLTQQGGDVNGQPNYRINFS
jgi:hypothetical protein